MTKNNLLLQNVTLFELEKNVEDSEDSNKNTDFSYDQFKEYFGGDDQFNFARLNGELTPEAGVANTDNGATAVADVSVVTVSDENNTQPLQEQNIQLLPESSSAVNADSKSNTIYWSSWDHMDDIYSSPIKNNNTYITLEEYTEVYYSKDNHAESQQEMESFGSEADYYFIS